MASLGSSYVGPSLPSNCASRGFQEASRGCHGTLPPRITEYLRWVAEGRLRKLRVEREGKQNTSARERDAVVAHYTLCSAQGGPPLLSTRLSGDRGPRRWRCACGHEILTEGDEGEGLNVPAPAVDCAAMLMEEGEQAHFEALPELVAPREQIERGAVPTVTMDTLDVPLRLMVEVLRVEPRPEARAPPPPEETLGDPAAMSDKERLAAAAELKLRGNEAFKGGQHALAERRYTLALRVLRERAFGDAAPYDRAAQATALKAACLLNLAAPAARRGDFEGALALAEEALALGAAPSRRRALLRRARCLAALGRRGGAGDALWDLLLDEPPHSKGETPTEAEVIGELAAVAEKSRANVASELRERRRWQAEAKLAARSVGEKARDTAAEASAAAGAAAAAVTAPLSARLAKLAHALGETISALLARTLGALNRLLDGVIPELTEEEARLESLKPRLETQSIPLSVPVPK